MTPSKDHALAEATRLRAARWLPLVLALFLIAPAPFPTALSPAIWLWAALLLGALALGAAALAGRPPALLALPAGLLAATTVWLAVRSAASTEPVVSLWGRSGQHNGALLWLAALCWFVAAGAFANGRCLRDLLKTTAVAGAVFAALASFEALTSQTRGWGSTAGIFENSLSLGQFLALASLASLAWALLARDKPERWGALASGGLSLAGLVVAQSRAGVAAVVLGVVAAALLVAFGRMARGRAWVFAASSVALLLGTSLAMALSAAQRLGPALASAIAGLGNSRDLIWRSAVAGVGDELLLGRGLEQFSGLVSWSVAGGELRWNGTFDPHSLVLALLLGGGVVGLALASATGVVMLQRAAVLWDTSGRSRAVLAIIAALASVPAAGLFMWSTQSATIASAAIAGALLARARTERDVGGRWRIAGATAAALALVAAAWFTPALLAEREWAVAVKSGTITAPQLETIARTYPDAAFAQAAVNLYVPAVGAGDEQAARTALALSRAWEPAAARHVDLALADVVLQQAVSAGQSQDTWEAYRAALERGRAADPASGVWDTVGALEAQRLGKASEAKAYAKRALTFPLLAEERSVMESIAAE